MKDENEIPDILRDFVIEIWGKTIYSRMEKSLYKEIINQNFNNRPPKYWVAACFSWNDLKVPWLDIHRHWGQYIEAL